MTAEAAGAPGGGKACDSLYCHKNFPNRADPFDQYYASHTPYELTVSAADIAAGFCSCLYGLQGRRSTYWNGAAFQAHDSALISQFAETLLPAITG